LFGILFYDAFSFQEKPCGGKWLGKERQQDLSRESAEFIGM
jgi:hypothetical protein